MLKVTYGDLRDHNFARGMSKLANYSGFKTPAVAYNAAKINKRCMEEAQLADELFKKLVKQYAKLDDKGEIAPLPNQPGTFEIKPELYGEYDVKLKEFLGHVVEIDRPHLKLEEIADCGLTPLELGALDSFVIA